MTRKTHLFVQKATNAQCGRTNSERLEHCCFCFLRHPLNGGVHVSVPITTKNLGTTSNKRQAYEPFTFRLSPFPDLFYTSTSINLKLEEGNWSSVSGDLHLRQPSFGVGKIRRMELRVPYPPPPSPTVGPGASQRPVVSEMTWCPLDQGTKSGRLPVCSSCFLGGFHRKKCVVNSQIFSPIRSGERISETRCSRGSANSLGLCLTHRVPAL